MEAALNWRADHRRSTDWSYNFGVNATFNQNRIANLNGGQALFAGTNLVTKSDNGVAAGSFFLLDAIGVYQSAEPIEITRGPLHLRHRRQRRAPGGRPEIRRHQRRRRD